MVRPIDSARRIGIGAVGRGCRAWCVPSVYLQRPHAHAWRGGRAGLGFADLAGVLLRWSPRTGQKGGWDDPVHETFGRFIFATTAPRPRERPVRDGLFLVLVLELDSSPGPRPVPGARIQVLGPPIPDISGEQTPVPLCVGWQQRLRRRKPALLHQTRTDTCFRQRLVHALISKTI